MERLSPAALSTLGLAALSLYILKDAVFFGEAFFERDLAWLYYPQVEAFVRAVGEGALPLRDPTIGFGQPLLGSPDTQILYPPGWLHLILLPDQAYTLLVLIHFLLGGLGAAALCRRMSRSYRAGFFAGAFWIASGPFQSALNLWHHFSSAAWMPWVLLAFDRLLEKPDLRRMSVAGAVFGLQILAGSADLCAMTLLLALVRLLCEGRSLLSGLPRRGLMILGAITISVSLGAGVWLPALEVVRTSGRSALSREARTEWSVHPLVAVEMALPIQAGALPLSPESAKRLTDGRPPLLKTLFLGTLAIPLVAAGLLNAAVSMRHRLFLAIGGGVAVAAALGRFTPVYDVLVTLLPPLTLFRYPVKLMLLVSLVASLLAGFGVRALSSVAERWVVRGLCAVVFAAEVFVRSGVAGWLAPYLDPSDPASAAAAGDKVASALLWSALSLLALGLSTLGTRLEMFVPAAALGLLATLFVNRETNFTIANTVMRYRPEHVASLQDREASRLYAFPYLLYPDRLPEVLSPRSPMPPDTFILLIRSALMAPIGGVWKLEYAWDYDQKGLLNVSLTGLTQYINRPQRPPAFLRMLQVANVGRVVDFYPLDHAGLTLERVIPIVGPRPLHVYRVSGALPRAYAVSGARLATTAQAQTALLDPRFDPRAEVAVDIGPPSSVSPGFTSEVRITERRSDRIVIEAVLNEPGHVVLLEGFLPGWHATVSGVPVTVKRANALFVAAATPSGRHQVVFTYRPWSALAGIAVTAFSALALLAALAYLRSPSKEA